jgi:DNA-binding beta-propeller fold protein YncE
MGGLKRLVVLWILAGCGRIDFDARFDARNDAAPSVFGYAIAAVNELIPPPAITTIAAFTLDPASGAVVELPELDLGAKPQFVLPNRNGTALYVTSRDTGTIFTLRVDRLTGALSPLGQVAAAAWPHAMVIDPSGRWLYASDWSSGGNFVWGYAIGSDDTLSPLPGSPWTYAGTSSTALAVEPTGRWLYAVDANTKLYGFAIAADGTLAVQPAITWPSNDSYPMAAVFDGSGRYGFIAPTNSGGVPGFTLDVATGALSTTPGSKFQVLANTDEFEAVSASGDILLFPYEGGPTSLEAFQIADDGSVANLPGSPLLLDGGSVGVAASPLGNLAVFTDFQQLVVVHADTLTGLELLGSQALASMPHPYQVVLANTP